MKNKMVFSILAMFIACSSHAQLYTLFCSKSTDMNQHSVIRAPSTIYIDSGMVTIEQGEQHLYLEIKTQQRQENVFIYNVIDYNDQPCTATFQPEEMQFDFRSKEFWLRYNIDSMQAAHTDTVVTDTSYLETSDSTATDSVKEDKNIYDKAELMPEYAGGADAMKKFIAEHIKYPAAAKKEGIKGLVTVSAVVEKDGSLSGVAVKKDIGGGCGAEAVRVVKEMPTWVPGEIKGDVKRVKVTVTMFFPPME